MLKIIFPFSIAGGELFDRVIEDEFVLTEKACVCFMRQILDGVSFMHSKQIIHLDLKVKNIFEYFSKIKYHFPLSYCTFIFSRKIFCAQPKQEIGLKLSILAWLDDTNLTKSYKSFLELQSLWLQRL